MKHTQYELFLTLSGLSYNQLVVILNDKMKVPVSITLTRNRVSMISIDFTKACIKIRLHRRFLDAPMCVIWALKRYLLGRSLDDWLTVSGFARSISSEQNQKMIVPAEDNTMGSVFDLLKIFKDINKDFFSGNIRCAIQWGRMGRPRGKRFGRRRSVRFGSWVPSRRIIRVHPVLDNEKVPLEFIKYIVFHEMLHVVVPVVKKNGREYDHSSVFKALEKRYPGYENMKKMAVWILAELL